MIENFSLLMIWLFGMRIRWVIRILQLRFFVIIMQIRVLIFANRVAQESNDRLFERIIDWSDSIEFPYSHFFSVFRICFPNCLVVFELV